MSHRISIGDHGIAAWLTGGPLLRDADPHFSILASNGTWCFRASLIVNHSPQVAVVGVVALAGGGAVAAGSALAGAEGIARGFGVFDAAGAMTRFVRTDPYLPRHITVGGDGQVWLFGDPPDDGAMIRRYSLNGDQRGEALPRRLYPAGLSPALATGEGGITHLLPFEGGVGIWAAQASEWVEVRGNSVRRRVELPDFQALRLAAAAGRVFAWGFGKDRPGRLHELNLQEQSWKPTPGWEHGPNTPTLIGAIGDRLVVSMPQTPRQLFLTKP